MSVNPHPTHKGWWVIRCYPHGRSGGVKTFTLKKGTRADALKVEREILLQASPSKGKATQTFPTVKSVYLDFIEYYRMEHLPGGVEVMERYLGRWVAFLGKNRFVDITQSRIESYKQERLREGIKPTTINKELSALNVLCNWAQEMGYCDEIKIKRFPAKLTRSPLPDVPTREEVLALIDCMIWPRCGLFYCLYYGGLRKSEAIYLRKEDVYLDRGVMLVLGKGNKERVVPIVPQLRPVLEKRFLEVEKGLLWTTRNGKPITDLKKIIKLAKERSGLTRHIYPHLLRHAFGTHATMAGVGMRSLQNIMGHTSVKTTEVYTTLRNEALIEDLTSKFGK